MSSCLPRHLSTTLLCGLLWASGFGVQARELRPAEPLRVTLVSLARQATASSAQTDAKLSVRRAWASDTQAQICALTLDAQGQPVLEKGRFQVRRVQFEREQQQAKWRVQRVDTAWLSADASLDTVCPRARDSGNSSGEVPNADAPPTHLAKRPKADIDVALAEMARNPPTAGLPGPLSELRAEPTCPLKPTATTATTDVASWKPGRIEAEGRTHLFQAPDRACPMGKHLVQHDKVRIGPTQGSWVQVQYTHPITQVVTVGWLPGQRAIAVDTQVAGNSR